MNRSFCLVLLCPVFLTFCGCQPTVSSRLTGAWVGKPDTAVAARERVAKNQQGGSASSNNLPTDDAANKLGQTDLEQHDVTIELEFKSDKTVHMALAGDKQPREGIWRVLTTLPPDGAEIEISLSPPAKPGTQGKETTAKAEPTEKRRFVVDFQENGESPGFTMREKGADPKFGRLYFVKQK